MLPHQILTKRGMSDEQATSDMRVIGRIVGSTDPDRVRAALCDMLDGCPAQAEADKRISAAFGHESTIAVRMLMKEWA